VKLAQQKHRDDEHGRGGGVADDDGDDDDDEDDDERWRRGEKRKKTTKQRNKNENESGVCARFLYNALSVSPSTLPAFHGIFHPRGTCAASLCWMDENVD
jgi:hypothetical protein